MTEHKLPTAAIVAIVGVVAVVAIFTLIQNQDLGITGEAGAATSPGQASGFSISITPREDAARCELYTDGGIVTLTSFAFTLSSKRGEYKLIDAGHPDTASDDYYEVIPQIREPIERACKESFSESAVTNAVNDHCRNSCNSAEIVGESPSAPFKSVCTYVGFTSNNFNIVSGYWSESVVNLRDHTRRWVYKCNSPFVCNCESGLQETKKCGNHRLETGEECGETDTAGRPLAVCPTPPPGFTYECKDCKCIKKARPTTAGTTTKPTDTASRPSAPTPPQPPGGTTPTGTTTTKSGTKSGGTISSFPSGTTTSSGGITSGTSG